MQQQLKPALPQPRQRGITLIESLVAIAVAALGILGVLGVQMRTLSDTQTTVRRAQAIRLIEDLSERLKVHPNALNALNPLGGGTSGYIHSDWSAPLTAPGTDCSAASACTPSQLASYDLWAWRQLVADTLPAGDATVFVAKGESSATGNFRQLGVMISWRENERDTSSDPNTAYKDNIDTTQIRTGADTFVNGGGDVTCKDGQDGFTCHLQYIPVSARCAPDLWNGQLWYFCP